MLVDNNMISAYMDTLRRDSLVNVKILDVDESLGTAKKYRKLKAVIIKKFPNVTLTSRGTFMNKDLYFWNHGGIYG